MHYLICSLAEELNLKKFTANSEVPTTVVHNNVKKLPEKLMNVSISCFPVTSLCTYICTNIRTYVPYLL